MDSEQAKHLTAQPESKASQGARKEQRKTSKLPHRLDQLEWVAQHEFVPRLEAIIKVMLDEHGTLTVKRGSSEDCPGTVLVDLIFGREDATGGHWTAFLVRVELDPQRNMVCIQAGSRLHMNRQFPFGEEGWDSKLIDGFEWMLSDSMRPNLRIRNWLAAP